MSITIGDFNGDSRPDIAFRTLEDLHVLLNIGGARFSSATKTPLRYRGSAPASLLDCCDPVALTADFNGDGKLDFALSDSNEIMFGAGDGTFLAPQAIRGDHPTFHGLTATGDFDGDKKVDLVYFVRGSLAILLGNGDGTFRLGTTAETGSVALQVADFDRDGRSDLVLLSCADCWNSSPAINTWSGAISILFGQADGAFRAPVTSEIPLPWNWVQVNVRLLIADLNRDGWPDIATSNAVLLGHGDGAFQGPRRFVGEWEPNDWPVNGPAASADLDGDDNPDLVFFDSTEEGRRSIFARLGKGDGTLLLPNPSTSTYWLLYGGDQVDRRVGGVADLDGDGRPDLVTAVFGGGDGYVLPIPSVPVASSVTVLLNRIEASVR